MKWFVKLIAAVIVWVLAALLIAFVGGLLLTVASPQIKVVGSFFKENAGLLGFLAGAWFYFWGRLPNQPVNPAS